MLNTKADFQDCFKKIVEPLKKHYTPYFSGIKCGSIGVKYGEKNTLMEGFARVLWGLAPYWHGKGQDEAFEKIYVNGIINGTDPENEEYWGEMVNFDQKLVESASLGLSLILCPDKIWEPLTVSQKNNFYNWLKKVDTIKAVDNNWQLFAVMVNLGFKSVGMPYNKEKVEMSLSKLESYYKGNGWYTDGNTDQADYYVAFALHFYSLIYAKVMEYEDPVRSKRFKERAIKFAKDFVYWFDDDGSALAFGRSLTYRFAQSCFWSACIFAGIKPFSMGVMKGIISRNIEWWMNKPIFDNGNILTVGYGYPNLCMSEEYNSFCSPYWALKTFLVLSLDDEHEFFTTEPLPLPELDEIHNISEAKMVVHRIKGFVTAITAGQWASWNPIHVSEKYSKFIYSTKYAFCIPRSYYKIENAGTDNMLVFVKDDMCFVRKQCIESRINSDGSVYSKWSPYDGVVVDTYVIPTKNGHECKHTISCKDECVAYDCAFAEVNDMCEICGCGEKITIKCSPNVNLIYPQTKIKAIKYSLHPGVTSFETRIEYL